MIKHALTSLIKKHGVDELAKTDWCNQNLKKMLERWHLSPYVFNKTIGSNFTDLIKIAYLSGSFVDEGHSGSGMWASDRMLESTGATFVVGQGESGGTYFAIIFPKKAQNSDDIVGAVREELEAGLIVPSFPKAA